MRGRLLLFSCVALCVATAAGCSRLTGKGGAAGGLARPETRLNAAGESPSWSAVVRPGRLILSVGDAAPVQVKPDATDHGTGGASWSGALGGKPGAATLAVSPKPCHDSETGLSYPLTATATVQGRRYAGCAAPPGQGLGPRA